MFTEETVIVLGAGASCHYGYPTGEELIDNIVQTIKTGHFIDQVQQKMAFSKMPECKSLQQTLEFYDPLSIDAFLSQSIHNKTLVDEGMFFIAYEILRKEFPDKLNRAERVNTPTGKRIKECNNWYRFLTNALVVGSTPDELVTSDLKLNIVTFNYDVSIEYFLYSRFNDTPFFTKKQSNAFLEKLSKNIVHIYGQLEKYQWQGKTDGRNNTSYGHVYDNDAYKLAEQYHHNIRVMGKDRANADVIAAANWAKEKLENAVNIYFLGFGFNEDNVQLLDLHNTTRGARKIYCTNYGDSQKINNQIYKIFDQKVVCTTGNGERSYGTRGQASIHISTKGVYDALAYDFDLVP